MGATDAASLPHNPNEEGSHHKAATNLSTSADPEAGHGAPAQARQWAAQPEGLLRPALWSAGYNEAGTEEYEFGLAEFPTHLGAHLGRAARCQQRLCGPLSRALALQTGMRPTSGRALRAARMTSTPRRGRVGPPTGCPHVALAAYPWAHTEARRAWPAGTEQERSAAEAHEQKEADTIDSGAQRRCPSAARCGAGAVLVTCHRVLDPEAALDAKPPAPLQPAGDVPLSAAPRGQHSMPSRQHCYSTAPTSAEPLPRLLLAASPSQTAS